MYDFRNFPSQPLIFAITKNPQQMVRCSDVMARICPQFHPRPGASPCPWEFTVFSVTLWRWITFRFPCFFAMETIVFSIIPIHSPYFHHKFPSYIPLDGDHHISVARYSSASQGRAAPWQIVLKFVDEMKAWNPNKGPRLFWLEVEPPCFRGFQESPGGSRSLLGFQESPKSSRSLLKLNRKCPWSLLPKPNRKPDEFPTIPENQGRGLLVSGRVLVLDVYIWDYRT